MNFQSYKEGKYPLCFSLYLLKNLKYVPQHPFINSKIGRTFDTSKFISVLCLEFSIVFSNRRYRMPLIAYHKPF